MALTNEDLLALSEIIDKKLQPVNEHLDKMDLQVQSVNEHLGKIDNILHTLKFNQEYIAEKLKGIEVTMNYNDYHLSHDDMFRTPAAATPHPPAYRQPAKSSCDHPFALRTCRIRLPILP